MQLTRCRLLGKGVESTETCVTLTFPLLIYIQASHFMQITILVYCLLYDTTQNILLEILFSAVH